ncbi:MAG: AAA family ATPase, partial [Syntrophales bacterium]
MLIELSIRNFAIIDELTITFRDGLSIITGETGAGKSIIIGAMGLLLGDRANTDMIRSGADSATVDALFDIRDKKDLRKILSEKGFTMDDELIIRRVVSRSGKNRIYINGSPSTTTLLTEIAESLLSICSQHEHQVILQAQNHLDILDTYCRLLELRYDYNTMYHDFESLMIRL